MLNGAGRSVPFLTVIGHSNIDVQLQVAAMPGGGRSSPVTDRRTVYGGTANNIARHANGLGVTTRLWSRVGADFPSDWRAALESEGVELAFDDGDRTPTCFILTAPDGEQAYCMDQGAMQAPYPVPESVLEGAAWLHVATGDPFSYAPLMKAARQAGVKVALDPGQEIHFAYDERSFAELVELADVLFLNEVELEKAFDFMAYGDPLQFLDHVDALVVTRGADGADLYEAAGHTHVAPPAIDVVDPTGAGDALRAGWYSALHAGRTMVDALHVGVKAGAAACRLEGPQPRAFSPVDLELR